MATKAKPLTDVQVETLRDVRDGKVTVKENYRVMLGARLDVYGRLEERGLVEVDWSRPVNVVVSNRPRLRARYPVKITEAGMAALTEVARDDR